MNDTIDDRYCKEYKMYKKLVVIVVLLCVIPAMAMDVRMQETSQDERKVKILLQDEQNSESTYEVEVPVRLAKLIGLIGDDLLGDNPCVNNVGFPLLNVTLQTWRLIEEQLEHVYGIIHDVDSADRLKKEIFSAYDKLDSKSLSELIRAADYLEMPILLEITCDVVKKGSLDKLSFEEIVSLPGDRGNDIILHKLLMLVGPVPGREKARVQYQHELTKVCVTKDGKVVSGSRDKTVHVRDMQGQQLAVCRGHVDWVISVCVTKDGKIVSGSGDKTVRVWDMQGKQLAGCEGHEGAVWSVCVTNGGKIVSGAADSTVRVWDMEGNQLAVCRGHDNVFTSVCATNDGKIVSGSWDGTVRVWDMQGNPLAVCRGHESAVMTVSLTSDGKIVSGSLDKTVRVWDMEGNPLAVCRGHEDAVRSVCVTNDGKIVSGSLDKTVRVWDTQGNELSVCRGHESSVRSIYLTDAKIVSGSDDATIRVWDIGLLSRIRCMDEFQAQAVWKLLQRIAQHSEIDKQKCWQEIDSILMEESLSSSGNNVSDINNNNNTSE